MLPNLGMGNSKLLLSESSKKPATVTFLNPRPKLSRSCFETSLHPKTTIFFLKEFFIISLGLGCCYQLLVKRNCRAIKRSNRYWNQMTYVSQRNWKEK